jgi:adenylylsulfate kinase
MKNIFLNNFTVTRQRRNAKDHYKSVVIWFTGLSGSGKTTLAQAVEEKLHQAYCRTMLLDGDNIRHGLCKDLGFSNEDRKENIRRIGEVAKLFIESGAITLVSFISPFKEGRDKVKELLGGGVIEIYVKCPINVCENRDVKGMYKKSRANEIEDFTGIDSLYETPISPDLIVYTDQETLGESVNKVLGVLINRGIINNEN